MRRRVPFVHPGVIFLKDWVKAIGAPPRRINEIVKGLRGITVDTALRLSAYFGTDAQIWLNLQDHYDAKLAREAMADVLGRIARHQGRPA